MIQNDLEKHFDLQFECALDQGPVTRTVQVQSRHLRVESFTATVPKTTPGVLALAPSRTALYINSAGTLILRSTGDRIILIPPRSVTLVRSSRQALQIAKGNHQGTLISWSGEVTPILERWLTHAANPKGVSPRLVACKQIDPSNRVTVERLQTAISGGPECAEPLLMSVIYELCARIMVGPDEVRLATVPADLPETIRDLTLKVRSNPRMNWPLKDAADEAGYSAFHFSRIFKALVGYGFHEFVDRCRTELAIELLCNTDARVDSIASGSGFGTTQGLRESIKEYLGLVPSELRAGNETHEP